jgi:hypothetical protein
MARSLSDPAKGRHFEYDSDPWICPNLITWSVTMTEWQTVTVGSEITDSTGTQATTGPGSLQNPALGLGFCT